jgi:bacterioferritin-associated ferredoxin
MCHCQVVNDRRIRAEIEAGAVTVDEISERCGAGARCGSCRPTISVLLATMVAADQVEPAA